MLVEIGCIMYLVEWRGAFWNSAVNRDYNQFIQQLWYFLYASLTYCFVYGTYIYFKDMAVIKWREIINKKALCMFHENTNMITNINQRIQEDCIEYPRLYLKIIFGVIRSVIYLIVFSIELIYFSNAYFLLILVGYSIVATLITKKIAAPLINLNYESQCAEASYRNKLNMFNFSSCVSIMTQIARKKKRLSYFQSFYGQLGILLPLVLIIPQYFFGSITFGGLMQITKVMDIIIENLSYGINSFGDINKLLSCKRRLKEADII